MLAIKKFAPGLSVVGLLCWTLVASSCSKRSEPKLEKPATWAKYGLTFQYPSNWRVGDELDRGEGIEITTVDIESKGTWDSSSAMLQTFEPALPVTFEMMANQYLGELPEVLDESGMKGTKVVDKQPVTHTILGQERLGRRVQLRGTVDGEARDIVTELHVMVVGNRTIILQTQAPMTELEAASAVFEMVRATLNTLP